MSRVLAKPVNLLFWFCLLASLSALIQFCHQRLDLLARAHRTENARVILPNVQEVRLLSLGYDRVLADIYWLLFIQYLGDVKERALDHYQSCYDYLNLVTALDPHFIDAYWFTAFAVGAEQNRGDLASKILVRGIEQNQNDWNLPYIAGINKYLFENDELAAAKYYKIAARFPGAPPWLAGQAKILEAKLPPLFKEIRTWTKIYESNNKGLVKQAARNKLVSLWRYVYRHTPVERSKQLALAELKKLGAAP